MKRALIIFVRPAQAGKVKTRIARAVGDVLALEIYKRLLLHTREVADAVAADRFVFYADEIPDRDIWHEPYWKYLQSGEDLGKRMSNAFQQIFNLAYEKAVIIGSDCYALTAAHIEQAFEALHHADAVIGPAKDGGYYLLALRRTIPEIFEHIPWSTSAVLSCTVQCLQKQNRSYTLLETLPDVDEWEDVPEAWKRDLLQNKS